MTVESILNSQKLAGWLIASGTSDKAEIFSWSWNNRSLLQDNHGDNYNYFIAWNSGSKSSIGWLWLMSLTNLNWGIWLMGVFYSTILIQVRPRHEPARDADVQHQVRIPVRKNRQHLRTPRQRGCHGWCLALSTLTVITKACFQPRQHHITVTH